MSKISLSIDAVMEINQGDAAFPHIVNTLQPAKITGFAMPGDPAANNKVNFKVAIPPGLDVVPNARIRVYYFPLDNNVSQTVSFNVLTAAIGPGESASVSYDSTSVTGLPISTIFTLERVDISFSTFIVANDLLLGQLERVNGSGLGGDIMIPKIQLLVDADVN